jgi:hypothetical protein
MTLDKIAKILLRLWLNTGEALRQRLRLNILLSILVVCQCDYEKPI